MAAETRSFKGWLGPVLIGLGLGMGVAGGCQPRHGYYQDTYEEERVITPSGVGDSLAVYRTSSTAPARETRVVVRTTSANAWNGASVVVVDRSVVKGLR